MSTNNGGHYQAIPKSVRGGRPDAYNEAAIEVVDPQPIDLGYERIEYHRMTAAEYVSDRSG